MLANGCFVSDASHRYDDPEQADHLAGLQEQGPDADRRQLLAGRERRRDQRRDDRRALRDRRQQRRHARHRAVLDRRRRAGAGDQAQSSTRAARLREWTLYEAMRCAPDQPALHATSRSPREALRARARQRALRAQRRQPPGLARGRRARTPRRAGRCATSTCPRWRAYLEHTGGARDAAPIPTTSTPRRLRMRAAAPTNTREQLDEVPLHLVVGVRLGDLAVTDARAAAPEHRRRRLDLPVRAEPAARAARRGPRRRDDDAARAGRGRRCSELLDDPRRDRARGARRRRPPRRRWPSSSRASRRGVRLRRALRRARWPEALARACGVAGCRRNRNRVERGRSGGDFQAEPGRAVGVGELLGERADAVGGGQRGELDRREHAERVAVGVEEAASGVAGDAGGRGVELLAPAAPFFLIAEAHAGLRAERADAQAQDRVAVAEDPFALRETRRAPAPLGPPQNGTVGLTLATCDGSDLDQSQVVIRARVRVFLLGFLHRDP